MANMRDKIPGPADEPEYIECEICQFYQEENSTCPDRRYIENCKYCGKLVCDKCYTEKNNIILCEECIEEFSGDDEDFQEIRKDLINNKSKKEPKGCENGLL